MRTRRVNFIDLFAGAGGLSQGFRQASSADVEYRSIFAVEKDKPSAAAYSANFGHEVFSRPIEELRRGHLPKTKVDLVIGGPPCQGFSPLGKMSPTKHHYSMNKLWHFYFKVVEWKRPKVFVIENVPEFLKSGEFQGVVRTAESLGYEVASGVLHATKFGVPQQRRRGFVICTRTGHPMMPDQPDEEAASAVVSRAIGNLEHEPLVFDLPVNGSLHGFPKYRITQLHIGRRPTPISLERYKCVPPGGNRFDLMRLRRDLTPKCWLNKPTGSTDVFGRLRVGQASAHDQNRVFQTRKGLLPASRAAQAHYSLGSCTPTDFPGRLLFLRFEDRHRPSDRKRSAASSRRGYSAASETVLHEQNLTQPGTTLITA